MSARISCGVSPAASRALDRHHLAALDLLHVPLAHPGDGGDPELAERGGLGGDVAQLLGELARPLEGFRSGIEVDLPRCAERLAEGHSQQVLPKLQARRQLGRAVAARVGDLAHRPRQLGGLILVLGHAQRGSAAQLDVELEVGVTQSLRQRRQLGEAFETVGGAAQHAQGFVAGGEQRETVLRCRSGRQALVDDAKHLLRRAGVERCPCGRDGETHGARLVARREGVMSEQGHALGGRVAAGGQHVDERGVDRTPPLGGEQRAGELADLVVSEAVVGGRSCGVLEEKACRDSGRQRLGETVGLQLPRPPRAAP